MLAFIVAASNRMPPGNHDRTSGYTLEVTHRAQEKEGNCAMLGFAFHDGSLFKRIRHAPCIWALHASMAPQCMHTHARTVYGCGHQTDFLGAPECRPQGLLAGAEVAVLLGGALRDTRPLLLGWAAPGLIHKVDIQLLDVPAIAWQRRGSTARQRSSSRIQRSGVALHRRASHGAACEPAAEHHWVVGQQPGQRDPSFSPHRGNDEAQSQLAACRLGQRPNTGTRHWHDVPCSPTLPMQDSVHSNWRTHCWRMCSAA